MGVHGLNVKRAGRSIDRMTPSNQSSWLGPRPRTFQLTALPISHQSFAQGGPDHLRTQAESLIRTLSTEDVVATRELASTLELIVDGYAHVLALDVDCMRLEREIGRLAQSGDPHVSGELRELSALLHGVTSTSEELRRLLDAARARVERRG